MKAKPEIDRKVVRRGAEAHYEDALYYDQVYRRRREDVEFYADLAERNRGPVLELGAGTGRVSFAIAERGVEVVAVDRMKPMLDRAKARLAATSPAIRERVSLVRGDLRKLRLSRKFPLVIAPFNVFMHLYTRQDVEGALATVRAHLRPKGQFVFDVLMPDLRALVRDPERYYPSRPIKNPSDGQRYAYGELFHYDAVSQVQLVSMVFTGKTAPFKVSPLTQRQFFPAELDALLHYNGFEVLERYGEFDRSPLESESDSIISVCRARSKR